MILSCRLCGAVENDDAVGFMLFYNQQIDEWIWNSVNLVETEKIKKNKKIKPLTDSTIATTNHPYMHINASEGPNETLLILILFHLNLLSFVIDFTGFFFHFSLSFWISFFFVWL